MTYEEFHDLLQIALSYLLQACRSSPDFIPANATAGDVRLYASAIGQLDWAIDATQKTISKFEELSKRQPMEGGG